LSSPVLERLACFGRDFFPKLLSLSTAGGASRILDVSENQTANIFLQEMP